jgi:hypothetical protein
VGVKPTILWGEQMGIGDISMGMYVCMDGCMDVWMYVRMHVYRYPTMVRLKLTDGFFLEILPKTHIAFTIQPLVFLHFFGIVGFTKHIK